MSDNQVTATSAGGQPTFATATKTVSRDIGALQVLIGGSMLVPMLISLLYQEWYSALAFPTGAGITALVGGVAYSITG